MSLENEEGTELSQSNSDASSESSSETHTPAAEPSAESAPKAEPTPFHEHPRFKELIEEKNQFSEKLKEYEKRFSQYEERFKNQDQQSSKQASDQRQALLSRLKGIDPEFGGLVEQMVSRADKFESVEKELNELRSWRDQTTTQTATQQVQSELQRLHTENKVPKEWQHEYQLHIKELAMANPQLGNADLPKVYAQVHAQMSKKIDALRRQDRASYVADKKSSSSVPAASRGPAPKPNGSKVEYSKDPEQARGQLVQQIMKNLRSQKQDI